MMLRAFTSAILVIAFGLSIAARMVQPEQSESQESAALLARPALTCDRADLHRGLYLKITNNGSSNIGSGSKIRYAYQLSTSDLGGEGSLQLLKPLLPGQSLQVSIDGAKRNSFQVCTASLDQPVLKLPPALAPRQ